MKLSVIIPCYNAATTLARCIKSVLAQSYRDFELILINDGSNDNTLSICQSFADIDERILVVDKKNTGVSDSRNRGIFICKGDYFTFIDADDYIEYDYFEQLIYGTSADFVVGGFKSSAGIHFCPSNAHFKLTKYCNIDYIIEDKYLLFTPWGKLFKKEIAQNHSVYFDKKLRFGEDTIFCLNYLIHCKNIAIKSISGYYYDGEWGGGNKYNLTEAEVEYLDKQEYNVLKIIKNSFNSNINLTIKAFHINAIGNLYSVMTDEDTYNLYLRTHDYISKEEFVVNKNLCYVYWGLIELEGYYLNNQFSIGRKFIADLYRFCSIKDTRLFKSYPIKLRVIHFLLTHGQLNLLQLILIVIALIKCRCLRFL